jgi:5-methylcytosine-specific restriction endonuclease McrA
MAELKRCARCEVVQPLDAFGIDRRRPDGRNCYCLSCARAKASKWSTAHPGVCRDTHRRWKVRNLEKEQAGQRAWTAANKERENARKRTLQRKRRVENPERSREIGRRTYAKHAEKWRAHQRALTKTPEGLAKATEFNRLRRARLAGVVSESINCELVYARDNYLCARCGLFVEPGTRSLDHRIPITKGGSHTYDNVQLMHRVCNSKKYNRLPDYDVGVLARAV